ncbi:hypothetical protein O3P69_008356 [Scylla paramamosain]|uniref:Uncharacterized protein n=1 Tax=Scylla paramamosain TaxID=85552 RepID=A0AAW0SKJ5_SCYPA
MGGGASLWAAVVLVACSVHLHHPSRGAAGVQVLRFQEDRVATSGTQAWYKGKLEVSRQLSSVTLCGRVFLFTLHTWATFIQLKNSNGERSILEGDIWLDRVRPVIAQNWNFQLLKKKLWVFRWHHLCFTYDAKQHILSTYVDGHLNNDQDVDFHNKYIAADGAVLGQGVDYMRSFSGNLTQVNVWDRPLSADEIRRLAKCEDDQQGNYISWNVGWTLQDVTSYEVPLTEICKQEADTRYFWFPSLTYNTALYLCRALGSTLPAGTSIEEAVNMATIAHSKFQYYQNCFTDFWIGPNDIKEEDFQRFSFVGTCESELRNVYFTAFQLDEEELMFMGYGAYHIKRLNDTWAWINVVTNKTIAFLLESVPDFPMGRRWWQLEQPVCEQKDGDRRLLLSPCPSGYFTCNDATCIPLPHRCDLKYDCGDNSDEEECELVSFPEGYQKHLPPRSVDSEEAALSIVLTVIVESLAVKTIDMVMEVSYQLMLTWRDNRLLYQDLKVDSTLNVLPGDTMERLWTPEVDFINTIKSEHTLMDGDSLIRVDRRATSIGMKPAVPAEVELFSGEVNTLTARRKYGTSFMCHLSLVLYPFDVQECFMHFRISSATKFFLLFDTNMSSVNISANRFLVEYEVGDLSLEYGDESQFSEVKVIVPLTRRSGYAILNIYLPTLVLLIVSYVTLFIRPAIIDVRMTSALTVQLVIATLFSQVSASLPKTSYFKMVDLWLIFCISITFITIIFHVVVDNVMHGEPATSGSTVWVNSLAKSKLGPVVPGHTATAASPSVPGREVVGKRVVTATKVMVPVVFIIFNSCYWGYIMSQ